MRDPVPGVGVLKREASHVECIAMERARAHAREPVSLDRVHPPRTRGEQRREVVRPLALVQPATGARTLTWKPEARRVVLVDCPDAGVVLARCRRRDMRPQQADAGVFREMEEPLAHSRRS